ncbi:hypothetical protein [Comamonas aquatica]|uniref:phage head spike fiber domain-containing protein n=1 Tax=Comamonas aquatica TaxID=225991 RepID=UPI0028D439AC|nr:hypothetical protein [Comamonas aquatica]
MTAIANLPDLRPSLLLDFANSGRVDPRIQCTRASSATCFGPDGKLRTVAANVPRIAYDPATGKCLGLLVEESRSNLFSYTKDFPQSVWGKINLAPTVADAVIAPDGTLTADGLVPNTSNVSHYVDRSVTGLGIASSYCGSIYVKKGTARDGLLRMFGTGNAMHGVRLNFDTGVATFINSNEYLSQGGVTTSWGAENVGNGWWRLWVAGYPDAAADRRLFRVTVSNSAGIENYEGDGLTPGKYVWGAQFEAGTFPTSYIPTEGSAVTRASDVPFIAGSWASGTVLQRYRPQSMSPPAGQNYFTCALNAGSARMLGAYYNGNKFINLAGVTAGSLRSDSNAIAMAFGGGGVQSVANGGAMTTGAYTDAVATSLHIGTSNVGITGASAFGPINGHVEQVAMYSSKLVAQHMQRLTA